MGLTRQQERAERTLHEMEMGRKRQHLYELMERLDGTAIEIRNRFPTLRIDQTVRAPYDHVTLTVQSKATRQTFEIVDPVNGFPTDHCIAQLMLLS